MILDYKRLQTRQDLVTIDMKVDQNSNDWKMVWEWHEQVEILYILDGTGECCIGDDTYSFKQGDLIIIGPHKLHKTRLIDRNGFKALVLLFSVDMERSFPQLEEMDVLDFIKVNYADFTPLLTMDSKEKQRIEFLLGCMLKEFRRSVGGTINYLISLLHILMIEIERIHNKRKRFKLSDQLTQINLPRNVVNVIGHINQHFKDDLSLSSLSTRYRVNASYLSREFKRNTDLTIIEFLNSRRIHYARTLLAKSDFTITEVALESGYNNIPYFTSVFKNFVGMTPKQFKKKSQKRACSPRFSKKNQEQPTPCMPFLVSN